jgi:hypothetical protein
MINYDWECVGVYGVLVPLVSLPDFAKVCTTRTSPIGPYIVTATMVLTVSLQAFVQQLGVPRLLDIYVKTSIMLLGEHQTNTMGDMDVTSTSNISPRSSDVFSSDDNSFDSSDEEDAATTPVVQAPSVGFSFGTQSGGALAKMGIPKLALAPLNLKAAKSRNRRPDRSIANGTQQLFEQTSLSQLEGLASSLGETCMPQPQPTTTNHNQIALMRSTNLLQHHTLLTLDWHTRSRARLDHIAELPTRRRRGCKS